MSDTHLFTPFVNARSGLRAHMQLSDEDMQKIGRGAPWEAEVLDKLSGRTYKVRGVPCGLDCFCAAAIVREIKAR